MALTKGVNSNVSLEEANAYFADRIDSDAWVTTDSRKSQALITATSLLNDLPWSGIVGETAGDNAFPRIGTYFDPRTGRREPLSPTPKRVYTATYELAYHLLLNKNVLDESGGIDDLGISGISLNNIKTPGKISGNVLKIVRPMLINNGSNTWWRAN